MKHLVARASVIVSIIAVAVWLGGLVVLGAIAAPVVFSVVPFPWNADAMTIVFRRFDTVAMSCGAVVLVAEATQAALIAPFAAGDRWRAALSALAAAAAAFEGTSISPRIAALHAAGAVRGIGSAGSELARLHDMAEWLGTAQLLLLVAMIALRIATGLAQPTSATLPKRQEG